MSRWWRAYDDALHDPKVQKLPPHLFKTWFNLLCIASKNCGALPDENEIAFLLRRRAGDVRRDVAALLARRLFDAVDGQVVPHNWDSRQYKSDLSTQRVSKHRKRFSNVSSNVSTAVSETPPETDTDTDTEAEKKEPETSSGIPQIVKRETSDEADLFRRGKVVLGNDSGGFIVRLLKSKKGNVALARAAIEQASTKHDPREYIGAILRGPPDARHTSKDPLAGII